MILTGDEILKRVEAGDILIEPFDEKQLGPNSYDVRIGPQMAIYELPEDDDITRVITYAGEDGQPTQKALKPYLDPTDDDHPLIGFTLPPNGQVLHPGQLYLGHTNEKLGSDLFIPMIEGRSSFARLGMGIHKTAGFGDLGYKGQWTLEIDVILPIRIFPVMRVAQVYFTRPMGKITSYYRGKYQNAEGVVASRISDDYEIKIAKLAVRKQKKEAAEDALVDEASGIVTPPAGLVDTNGNPLTSDKLESEEKSE